MIDQDYVTFCNFAFDLRQSAETFCATLADEEVKQLNFLVRTEISAAPPGKPDAAYHFLAAILADAVRERQTERVPA
ncbi:hypothetical protein KYK29_04990 [Shinella daejeonensis]|uniref:hypothetical protein n=1 Tax=Shinella daejeonensis TaxID=659017 RepID=UPI0020C7E786|nr:hypothetical protein [Shinella daejeonensis]MCP8894276.1 hypothetical protein [Shinella daejeonensis]